jgi:hypothetical protein
MSRGTHSIEDERIDGNHACIPVSDHEQSPSPRRRPRPSLNAKEQVDGRSTLDHDIAIDQRERHEDTSQERITQPGC